MMYDAVIIGGGVVGLSILHAALLAGYDAVLLERNDDLCDGASGRNSGVLCTGVDAPPGSLERALIRDSISRVREFCAEHNVPMRECGSLVCLWPWDEEEEGEGEGGDEDVDEDEKEPDENREDCGVVIHERLRSVLRESHIAGDGDVSFLTREEVARLEPSLSDECRGAVHIPGETVVDPWLFPLALVTHSRKLAEKSERKGDVIRTGREVVLCHSSFDEERSVWKISTRGRTDDTVSEDEMETITARCVINAAGIDSDLVQMAASSASRGNVQMPCFEARPRRGQYLVFAAPKEVRPPEEYEESKWSNVPRTIPTRPIQPVPSQFTKGIFVYSTLYDQMVVGPTAQDQLSRTDAVPDAHVANALAAHASRILGLKLDALDAFGEYVGIRPGTSERDYQIGLHCRANFVTVGGVRSTGLTASLGIGRHVVQCLLPVVVPHPRWGGSLEKRPPPTPLPNVDELADQYCQRGDGRIVVEGHEYKVTHPLTRMGWSAGTGIAA